MLNQIVSTDTVLPHIGHNLTHHIVLVVAWENQLFLGDSFSNAVLDHFLLFLHKGNKPVDEVEQAVTLQHFLPEIACGIAVGILGITCTASHTGTIGASVERQKVRTSVCKLGSHPCFVKVNGKVNQKAVIQAERKFLGAAVMLELVDGADIVLPSQLVFQFQRNHWNAVHGQHHVDGVGIGGGIAELTGAAEDISLVALNGKGIQIGLRLKETDLQLAAHILNAVAEDIQQALIGDSGFQTVIQLVRCFIAVKLLILCPFLRLGFGDKLTKHIHIDALFEVMLPCFHPISISVLTVKLNIATRFGNQKGLYISFKSLFTFIHMLFLSFC